MSKSTRVLIVDDEDDIRNGVSRRLIAAGFDTMIATDGESGVRTAHTERPDIILMDVLMPKKDGMEALVELRSSPLTRHIPVVMLSASLRDEQRALDAGATFFVRKPFDGKTLLQAVNAAEDRMEKSECCGSSM